MGRHARGVVLTGPASAPIDPIRDRSHWLRSHSVQTLGKVACYFCERWRPRAPRAANLRVIVDRDPGALL